MASMSASSLDVGFLDPDLFVLGESELRNRNLLCSICEGVLRDAVQTNNGNDDSESCGHLFCQGCITSWLVKHDRCPMCNATVKVGQFVQDSNVRRVIRQLRIKCPNEECRETGELAKRGEWWTAHSKHCLHEKGTCALCNSAMLRALLVQHGNEGSCAGVRQWCTLGCGSLVVRDTLDDHIAACPARRKPCSLCQSPLAESEQLWHERLCSEVVVPCEFAEVGCDHKWQRGVASVQLQMHLQAHMPQHMLLMMQAIKPLLKAKEELAYLKQQLVRNPRLSVGGTPSTGSAAAVASPQKGGADIDEKSKDKSASTSLLSAAGYPIATWEWRDVNDWKKYDERTAADLEEAFNAKQPFMKLTVKQGPILTKYNIILQNGKAEYGTAMIQENIASRFKRQVRRTPSAQEIEFKDKQDKQAVIAEELELKINTPPHFFLCVTLPSLDHAKNGVLLPAQPVEFLCRRFALQLLYLPELGLSSSASSASSSSASSSASSAGSSSLAAATGTAPAAAAESKYVSSSVAVPSSASPPPPASGALAVRVLQQGEAVVGMTVRTTACVLHPRTGLSLAGAVSFVPLLNRPLPQAPASWLPIVTSPFLAASAADIATAYGNGFTPSEGVTAVHVLVRVDVVDLGMRN